jgi:hypothetical protein
VPGAVTVANAAVSPPRPARTVVILQSNYLPWRGYFDLIRRADVFVQFDVVQYTKNDWRNRNRIKTPGGPQWLTIPVRHSLASADAIDQTVVSDLRWADKHIKSLVQNYSRAGAFKAESPWLFHELRSLAGEEFLSVINRRLLGVMCEKLGIATPLVPCTDILSRDTILMLDPNARLVALCEAAGATVYLSGSAAKSYLDVALFAAAGIDVHWMSYENYPAYPQLWGDFEPKLSIVDLLLNAGSGSPCLPPLPGHGNESG